MYVKQYFLHTEALDKLNINIEIVKPLLQLIKGKTVQAHGITL
jgi:hypothetical protein